MQKKLFIQRLGRGTRSKALDRLKIPKHSELLEALGRLAVAHTHLELILRYTVKTLAGLSPKEGLDATDGKRTSDVRGWIRKLFAQKKPLESEKVKLEALLRAAARLSKIRNDFPHSAWSETPDGEAVLQREDYKWEPAPTKEKVDATTNEVMELATEINDARFKGGFIYEAVERTRLGKE